MLIMGYLASVLKGLSLGLIGGGGSILTVPILVYLFKIPPVVATGYSLFIVGLTALFGSFSYFKAKRVDVQTAALFGAPSFFGVFLARAYLVPSIPNPVLQIGQWVLTKDLLMMAVFAILMIVASFSMIREKTQDGPKPPKKLMAPWKSYALIMLEGLVVGGITGLVGAGGGFLIIPALVLLRGLSMRLAVGTSLVIIAVKSLFGFLGDVRSGALIDWTLLLTIAGIAIVGIFVGSSLAPKIDEKLLKRAFGYFVLVMGSAILIQQLTQ